MNTFKNSTGTAVAIAMLAILLATLGGCKKFLEPKSQSEFSPTDITQLNELILSAIIEPNDNSELSLTGGFLDILSDDVQTLQQFIAPYPPADTWYSDKGTPTIYGLYTWQPNYSIMETNAGRTEHGKMYNNVYTKLVYTNSALDYIDRVSGSREMKHYVTAQAKTLRGFYYLHLVNMFGVPYNVDPDGPGIPVRTTGARENRKMERNTVREVYARVEDDLLSAIEIFESLDPSYHFREYRPSLPMALLLISRMYLYMEEWEKAEYYADKLITEWQRFQILSLDDVVARGYTNVDPQAVGSSDTTILWKQSFYPDFVSYKNPDVIWPYGAAADAIALTGQEFTQSNAASKPRIINNGSHAILSLASPDLINSYDPDDLRLRTYLVRSLFNEPNYETTLPFDPEKIVYRAYAKLRMSTTPGSSLPMTDGTSFGFALRITEAYLILAEAQAMQPAKQGQALATLEKIWENRFEGGVADVPNKYKTGDVIELVRAERRRELCFESLRWFDLRRWGMKRMEHIWYNTQRGTRQVYVLEEGDPGFTLPMPDYLLQKNPDLKQVPMAYGGNERPAQS